ncbi:hypothetical protein HPB49_010665 [Dermacentor silvarum]|uniref:Uncharacterized protein n=1 Tax=Dermacentor silvarum TaxID=543639 RepID=A0ACB8CEQ2_DERSI|nr:hypothetical protein HPB49_010665 [Dermacentor silvarum]
MFRQHRLLPLLMLTVCLSFRKGVSAEYYGKFIGSFKMLEHNVSGAVYAASGGAFYLVDFTYDGEGPDAFFWAGANATPDNHGEPLPNENGAMRPLGVYDRATILVRLNNNRRIRDYRYLSVFSQRSSTNFGWVAIPDGFEQPRPQYLGVLNGIDEVISDGVVLLDSRTIFLSNFGFVGRRSGEVHFMAGTGQVIAGNGHLIDDENRRISGYFGKNVTLTLSEGRSWDQYEWFAVCCLNSSRDLAHVWLPSLESLTVPVYKAVSSQESVTPSYWAAANAATPPSPTRGENTVGNGSGVRYLGRPLGNLDIGLHGVRGTVYAASPDTLVLQDFSYDGQAPESNFFVGTADKPDGSGSIVRNEFNSEGRLQAYHNQTILLRLPAGKLITDFKWFGVYSAGAKTTLGRVDIPADFDYPKPVKVAARIGGEHVFAEAVVVEDRKTIGLNHFFYDASAPDAFFIAGKESEPVSQGTLIQHEGERTRRLREHVDENLRLTLPGNLSVDDIDWFSVYCISCSKPLIAVRIPKGLNVPADTEWLKERSRQAQVRLQQAPSDPLQFANCETIIADAIQVAWHLETNAITFHVHAHAMPGMWTAFGVSGKADGSMMVGADVAVIFISKANSKVSVVDYYMTGKAQCSGTDGVCPDDKQGGTEDLTVISSSYANGIVDVVYSRKFNTGDAKDKVIPATGPQAMVAAQGPTDEKAPDTVLYHTKIYTGATMPVILQFDRVPKRNCPRLSQHQVPPPDTHRKLFGGRDLFKKYNIDTFTAQIGPTGGDRGYAAITGQSGWGISWWINRELIPVLHVERGKTYKFIVEGGDDDSTSTNYHPFYITDSAKGGGSKEIASLGKPGHLLFAGVSLDAQGKPVVTKGAASGRLCEWKEDPNGASTKAATFQEYRKTLTLDCKQGQPGHFSWTPDKNTPNVVYYQAAHETPCDFLEQCLSPPSCTRYLMVQVCLVSKRLSSKSLHDRSTGQL